MMWTQLVQAERDPHPFQPRKLLQLPVDGGAVEARGRPANLRNAVPNEPLRIEKPPEQDQLRTRLFAPTKRGKLPREHVLHRLVSLPPALQRAEAPRRRE